MGEMNMKIIDAHLHYRQDNEHFTRLARAADHENTQEHLAEVFQEQGIVHAVVMGNHGATPDAYSDHPPFFSYCIGADIKSLQPETRDEALANAEAHLRSKACVGIKVYAGYSPCLVGDPAFAPLYDLAATYNKPVAVHTGTTASSNALLKYSHPLLLDEAAVAFPRVQFVMCHLGNPWLMDAAAVLEKNKNVVADLSGLLVGRIDLDRFCEKQRGYVEQLKTWISYVEDYDKFMYGTDWPLANMSDYIGFVSRLIPDRHLEQVFYENAKRVYGIDDERMN
jgi:predicted TIM-barrel fold metal-dependent hydrolase